MSNSCIKFLLCVCLCISFVSVISGFRYRVCNFFPDPSSVTAYGYYSSPSLNASLTLNYKECLWTPDFPGTSTTTPKMQVFSNKPGVTSSTEITLIIKNIESLQLVAVYPQAKSLAGLTAQAMTLGNSQTRISVVAANYNIDTSMPSVNFTFTPQFSTPITTDGQNIQFLQQTYWPKDALSVTQTIRAFSNSNGTLLGEVIVPANLNGGALIGAYLVGAGNSAPAGYRMK